MKHSPQFDHLMQRYDQGRISDSMLRKYVAVGRITEDEYKEITGNEF